MRYLTCRSAPIARTHSCVRAFWAAAMAELAQLLTTEQQAGLRTLSGALIASVAAYFRPPPPPLAAGGMRRSGGGNGGSGGGAAGSTGDFQTVGGGGNGGVPPGSSHVGSEGMEVDVVEAPSSTGGSRSSSSVSTPLHPLAASLQLLLAAAQCLLACSAYSCIHECSLSRPSQ